jgi:cob(I)alamin adenosyltransferase
MEHFWLCGACSATMFLEKTRSGVRVVDKATVRLRRAEEMSTKDMPGQALAS